MMDKELLDKEVLCILDTRQIQRFMFRSNSYLDTLGGSDLMKHILNDAICFALHNIDTPLNEDEYDLSMDPHVKEIPYLQSDRIKFQLIICSAGNALCIVRTGDLCAKIIRKISRYYLDNTYSLNLSTAAVEKTDNLGNDIFRLYKRLNENKASSETSTPFGALPVVIREQNTGDPVIGFDDTRKDYYSTSSMIRRKEAKKRKDLVDYHDAETRKGPGNKDYLAIIHADGNSFGITIGSILQHAKSYEDGIIIRRQINDNITKCFTHAFERTVSEIKKMYGFSEKAEGFDHIFQLIHLAGDDINVICRADIAFHFVDRLFKNIKGSMLWDEPGRSIPIYMCAGIGFFNPNIGFHKAFKLAEECCDNAKSEAKKEKNLRNGLPGDWIDFQICSGDDLQELSMYREQHYITGEGLNLLLRPLCLDDEAIDQPYSFNNFNKRTAAIKEMSLSKKQLNVLKQSYSQGRSEFENWLERSKKGGTDFIKLLGKPLYIDDSKHAVWFDCFEILDFM